MTISIFSEREKNIDFKTYEEWVQKWYEWAYTPPQGNNLKAEHHLLDGTYEEGTRSDNRLPLKGKEGNVWFLGTSFQPGKTNKRKIQLPNNTAILVACVNFSIDDHEYKHMFKSTPSKDNKLKEAKNVINDARTILIFRENNSGSEEEWMFDKNFDRIDTTIADLVNKDGYLTMAKRSGDSEAYKQVIDKANDPDVATSGYYCFLKPENFKRDSTYTISIYNDAPYVGKKNGGRFSSHASYDISIK